MCKVFTVAVYLAEFSYGGPEEGGWWYQSGELVRPVRMFKNEDSAWNYCNRLNDKLDATLNRDRRPMSSVLSNGRFRARVEEGSAPQYFPSERPHYE